MKKNPNLISLLKASDKVSLLVKNALCIFILLGLLIALPIPTYAQNQDVKGVPIVQHFSKIDYMAGSQNWNFGQDSSGLLYIANDKGLLIYDGKSWSCQPVANKTIVRSILVDHDTGRIYVGAQGEFGYFLADNTGRLVYHSLMHLIPKEAQGFEDIWDIQSTSEGLILFCSSYLFKVSEQATDFIQTEREYLFSRVVDNKIYVQEQGVGLQIWAGEALNLIYQGDKFKHNLITGMLSHPYSSSTIISTLKEGLFLKNSEQIETWNTASSQFLKTYWANRIIATADHNLVVGTYHNGIVLLTPEGKITQHLNKEKGLANNTIGCLFDSPRGGIWIGMNNGMSYLNFDSPMFKIYSTPSVPAITYSTTIMGNYLYVATNNGLFRKAWNSANDSSLNSDEFKFITNTKGQCWSLNNIDNTLFLGHHEGTLQVQGAQATPISGSSGAWKIISVPNHPEILIESTYKGLYVLENDNGRWKRRNELNGFAESARFLEFENDHTLWVTHGYKGAFRITLDLEYRAIQDVEFYGAEAGFPSNIGIRVFKIYDKILFTGEEGIYSFNEENKNFIPFKEWEPIINAHSKVDRLFEDKYSNLWFIKDDQVGYIKKLGTNYEEVILTESRGQLVENFENIYTHDLKNVLISTESGILHYNPNQHETSKISSLNISQITINTDSILYHGHKGNNHDGQGERAKFTKLSPKYRDIIFKYGAILFPSSEHVSYSYYLEGYDQDWSHWGSKNEKEYTNLNHGSYDFKIKAKVGSTVSDIKSYAFIIAPYWYESKLAKIFYLLLFAVFIYLAASLPSKKYKEAELRIQKEKEEEVRVKELALLMQEERANNEMIRLKNNNLKAQIDHTQKELASTTMHLVQNGDTLLRIKEKIKNLSLEKNASVFKKEINRLVRSIDDNINLDKNWDQFSHHFDRVHGDYIKRLKEAYPSLSSKDLKLCAYLKMNLSTKEIAPLLNISIRGIEISRYRLRKKLELQRSDKLTEFLMGF